MARLKGHARQQQQGKRKKQRSDGSLWADVDELTILQANVKMSEERLSGLMDDVRESSELPGIICLQDPPPRLPWMTFPHYKLYFECSRGLNETDDPWMPDQDPDFVPVPLFGVFFLVHESIPAHCWNVEYHGSLVATLHLTVPTGEVHIHNVYNRNRELDIAEFVTRTSRSGWDITVGDFNLHHESWGGRLYKRQLNCANANTLYELMQRDCMELVTPPGTITYTRGESIDNTASCIDLAFISNELRPRFGTCGLRTLPSWRPSDHRAMQMTLDMKLYRDDTRS
ncbi:hypothetical protein FDECE_13757 [Fusarium decemcellulare]|nr:hypothetical protein FDECE_13757 [Fusarium decemcellulare]